MLQLLLDDVAMADKVENAGSPITIKKYANRRLYNTATSSYVTLDHLCQMVKDGLDFVVYDAKSGDDITRSVLTQIIVEEESKGQNMLPIGFLRQLIGLYGDNMQWMVPRYLEASMQSFSKNQEKMRDYFQGAFGGIFPFGGLDEMSKQNMALFERAMRMWTPFAEHKEGDHPAPASKAAGAADPVLTDLQKKLEELQKQVAGINKPQGGGD